MNMKFFTRLHPPTRNSRRGRTCIKISNISLRQLLMFKIFYSLYMDQSPFEAQDGCANDPKRFVLDSNNFDCVY